MENAEARLNELLQDDFYKSEFAKFLNELSTKSFLLGKLLEKIRENDIELLSIELISEFLGEESVGPYACGFFPQINKPLIIAISIGFIKRRYSFIVDPEWGLAHGLAHELGHCLNASEEKANQCRQAYGKFVQEPFHRRFLKMCTFKELRADEVAAEMLLSMGKDHLIDVKHIKDLNKILCSSFEYIIKTSRSVCEKKLSCPKYDEKQYLVKRIDELLNR
ncbi:hypothetical protein ACFLZC_02835 [Patescibacteria group bacterium]